MLLAQSHACFWPAPSPPFQAVPGASVWGKLDEPRLNFLPKSPLGRPDSADLLGATVSDVFDGLQWYETVTLVTYHPGFIYPPADKVIVRNDIWE
jgi:hypothetical protein